MSARMAEHDVTIAVVLYGRGYTAREIGKTLKRSKTTILNLLRSREIDRRPAHARDCRGSKNPRWKGGRHYSSDGYVRTWTPNGYRSEHRLISGAVLGNVVHHKDHVPHNNDPSNLEVYASHSEHRRAHAAEERAVFGAARHPEPLPGESNPRAKLKNGDVRRIRRLRGVVTQSELAKQYGVSKAAIWAVQTRLHWKTI